MHVQFYIKLCERSREKEDDKQESIMTRPQR